MNLLDLPIIARIRRNHGLEHATIHVLLQRDPHISLVGRSDWRGFSIYGEIGTDQLETAVHEALERMQAGETELAVHPRCGTMLTTTGLLSGTAAFLTLGVGRSRSRFRWNSLPEALLAAMIAAVVAQPLGFLIQQYVTTSSDVGKLQISRVYQQRNGPVPVHRVELR